MDRRIRRSFQRRFISRCTDAHSTTGSVCRTQRHVTWPTCVCAGGVYGRSSPVSLCSLRGPGSWCPGLGRLLASAALLCMAAGPGTDCQRPSDHQNCLSLHSSVISRPTRSSVPALDSADCSCECRVPSSHRRYCDCTASSAPSINVQTRLDYYSDLRSSRT